MKVSTLVVAASILLLRHGRLTGQVRPPDAFPLDSVDQAIREEPVSRADLIAFGVLSGVGGFGLAASAALLADADIATVVYSGLLGSGIGIPLGVWSANNRRGEVGKSLLASLAATGAGFLLGPFLFGSGFPVFFVVPAAQLYTSVYLFSGPSN